MAIDDLLDEHEQSEKVRTWLRENGAGLIGGIALGLALIGGWQWWQKQQAARTRRRPRSATRPSSTTSGQRAQAGAAEGRGARMTAPTPRSPRCGWRQAQLDAGQRDAAIATLRARSRPIRRSRPSCTQRLARLLIDAGKADRALRLLPGDSTDAEILQVRGDAQFALGHATKRAPPTRRR